MGVIAPTLRHRPRAFMRTLLITGLALLAAIWLIPFLFLVITSIRAQGDLISEGVFSIPRQFRWTNFPTAWWRLWGLLQE